MSTSGSASRHWSLAEIPYGSIAYERARSDPYLLYLVASASFVEIASDLYTRSLVTYFEGDPPLQRWLAERWEQEEIQHGDALQRYVALVWPEFDWEGAYQGFFAEYAPLCAVDQLGPTGTLELAGRCVVETGTSTFYSMLAEASPEPVLRQIAARIASDEQRHYNLFHYHYRRWAAKEGPSRREVLKSLWGRLREADQEDVYYAFKNIFQVQNPDAVFTDAEYRRFRRHYLPLARRHYPFRRAAQMFLKPLGLQPALQSAAIPLFAFAAWAFLF